MIRLDPLRPVVAAAALVLAAASLAQEPTIYRVEVIVLEHTSPFAAGEIFDFHENTFTDAAAAPADNRFSDDAAPVSENRPEIARPVGRFERLAADEFELAQTVERLTNASRFRVLGHLGWTQEALEPADALAFAVSSANTDGRVKGTITLSRSRFLRLDADLTFSNGDVTVDLNQSRRRVQTGRLHYLDHPYFGVLIQVSRQPSTARED